jgi:hypothetical protein
MTEEFCVTDKYGALRTDFTASEVESLDPQRREVFTRLLSAALDARLAETEMTDAVAAQADAVTALQRAEEAHAKANPAPDRIDELRRVIASQRGF